MLKDAPHHDSEAGPIRVLHVDDSKSYLRMNGLFLLQKGYNLKIAPVLSAEQGLEKLKDEEFDAIISDYMMPGMNGVQFLEALKKTGKDIPFIVFTGHGEESVAIVIRSRPQK